MCRWVCGVRWCAVVLVLGWLSSRVFFGVVAGFAQAGAIGGIGGSVVVPRNDVVEVPEWGVAVGGAAGVVAGLDEPAQPGREEPFPGVHPDELTGSGGGAVHLPGQMLLRLCWA